MSIPQYTFLQRNTKYISKLKPSKHNVATTSLQRHCNVTTLQRRCNEVDAMLCVCWERAPYLELFYGEI